VAETATSLGWWWSQDIFRDRDIC